MTALRIPTKKKEEYRYKGHWIVHVIHSDRNNPNLEIHRYSVWGLGIFNTMTEAHEAVDKVTKEE